MKLKEIEKVTEIQNIPAGGFSTWLRRTKNALMKNEGANVPCGECTACCTSSYFIHIKPDETQTLARIPEELLFPAPGLPDGNVLLGYDENGRCPMFVDRKCSIYDHRPQTCRTFDCRIFPATGFPAGEDKQLISRQARRWKFDFPTTKDHKQFSCLQSTAKFLSEQTECFPAGFVPGNTTQQAVLAIKVYDVFLNITNKSDNSEHEDLNHEIAEAVIAAYEKFETENID